MNDLTTYALPDLLCSFGATLARSPSSAPCQYASSCSRCASVVSSKNISGGSVADENLAPAHEGSVSSNSERMGAAASRSMRRSRLSSRKRTTLSILRSPCISFFSCRCATASKTCLRMVRTALMSGRSCK
eukprot:scaffold110951_cov57-Phaeocystis_antarctica.AAC.1